jgi:hypothetical protein
MKKLVTSLVVGAFVFTLSISTADARPNYLKAFTETYPDVKGAAEKKCNTCHEGTDKKMRNAYGKAVGGALGMPKVMDADKIKAALKKVEEENKEFGEKLKAGKLPVE